MGAPLTDSQRKRLEGQLLEQLRQDIDQCKMIGYTPRDFSAMLTDQGPIEACCRVILSDHIPDGFFTLWEHKRLELTAEATVLRGPWKALFDDAVLERARKRLRDYQRPDLALP